MHYLVLGAGPAGCSAGYHLAKSGHQVTLLDKSPFPRDKICGDGISFESVQALSTMGIYPQNIKRSASEFAPVNGLLLGISNGNCNMRVTSLERYCIPRFVFDNLLYGQAISAGCTALRQTITKLDCHQELYKEFEYIIDARGVSAGDANAIAIRAYWNIKPEDFAEPYRSKAHIYFDKVLGVSGYGWIFPVDTKTGLCKLNVGVILWLDEYQKLNTNIIRLFQEFIQRNQQTRELLSKIIYQHKPKVYPLATAKQGSRVSQGKVFMIGDAANLTDPLTGAIH